MARKPLRILAIAGSLRQGSHNCGLLRAAHEVAPAWVEVQFFDIGQLPYFSHDDTEQIVESSVPSWCSSARTFEQKSTKMARPKSSQEGGIAMAGYNCHWDRTQ